MAKSEWTVSDTTGTSGPHTPVRIARVRRKPMAKKKKAYPREIMVRRIRDPIPGCELDIVTMKDLNNYGINREEIATYTLLCVETIKRSKVELVP